MGRDETDDGVRPRLTAFSLEAALCVGVLGSSMTIFGIVSAVSCFLPRNRGMLDSMLLIMWLAVFASVLASLGVDDVGLDGVFLSLLLLLLFRLLITVMSFDLMLVFLAEIGVFALTIVLAVGFSCSLAEFWLVLAAGAGLA